MEAIDLGGHDEVALGQAIDLMSPQCDFGFAPGEQDVGMMSLRLGQFAYAIHEIQRLLEIGEGEQASDVVLVDHLPLGHLLMQRVEFGALERRHAAATGNAGFAGERCHRNLRRHCSGLRRARRKLTFEKVRRDRVRARERRGFRVRLVVP